MPSTIYNEGRVVGYSAYEIYVRHVLSEDPNHTPASELEWLSSSIAMGSSMLLKIPKEIYADWDGNGHQYTIGVKFQYGGKTYEVIQIHTSEPDQTPDIATTLYLEFTHHAIRKILPANTNLVAANTIIGSLFLGDAECDAQGWATKVTSYGPLLDNNSITIMGTHINTIIEPPVYPHDPLSSIYQDRILNYIKLVDGIVVQPGEWKDSTDLPTPPDIYPNPKHDLLPRFDFKDNGSVPYVRLYLSDRVTKDFYILLTGFTINGVINGVSGLDGSTDTTTNMHENGGFLGPAVFPWANKIIFSVPPAYANYFLDARYSRAIQNKRTSTSPESFGTSEDVRAVSVIDMESGNPNSYYQSTGSAYVRYDSLTSEPADWSTAYTRYYEKNQNDEYVPISGSSAPTWAQDTYYQKVSPCIGVEVTDCNKTTGDSILTVYQRNDILPPALYASKVSDTGEYELNPVDTIAPGTVKLYENDANGVKAKALEDEIPGNYALMRDTSDYIVKELDDNQNAIPVAETSLINFNVGQAQISPALAKGIETTTGKKTTKSLAMGDSNGQYKVVEDGDSTTISPVSGNIHWQILLQALANDKAIDIFNTIRFLDEFYRAAKARLLAGRGIAFNDDDDDTKTRTISADLTAGSGILISDPTTPAGNNSKQISANIRSGAGISVTPKSDGSIEIGNTAMYPGAATGYIWLQQDRDYTAVFHNAFKSYKSTDNTSSTTPEITVGIIPVFDSNSDLAQCYVIVSGTKHSSAGVSPPYSYHIGVDWVSSRTPSTPDGYYFAFQHSSDYNQYSRILSIKFNHVKLKDVIPGSDSEYYLDDLHMANWSVDPTSGGIWNMEDSSQPSVKIRASYPVYCNLTNRADAYSSPSMSGNRLILSAISIGDGFNDQYDTLANGIGIDVEDLQSKYLNIIMTGVFYV